MTQSVSIPERAREMSKTFFAKEVGIIFGSQEDALTALTKFAESAMRSERELCAKELEEHSDSEGVEVLYSMALMKAAKLLRDGGK